MTYQFFPLQFALSGQLELLITLIVLLLVVLIPAYLVYRDAKKRGMNAMFWAVLVGGLLLLGLLPGLAAVLYYLWKRNGTTATKKSRTA